MTGTESNLDSLVFDLVEWVGKEPRTYAQVMDAWRTSCPRLTVWEEAVERGFVVRAGQGVAVTDAGRAFLDSRRSEPKQQNETARDAMVRRLANNPRFKLMPPSGDGFVIVGAKPSSTSKK